MSSIYFKKSLSTKDAKQKPYCCLPAFGVLSKKNIIFAYFLYKKERIFYFLKITKNWKSHGDSYRLENTIENETNLITKLIFEPTIFCNPYNFKFVITNGKWIESDGKEVK